MSFKVNYSLFDRNLGVTESITHPQCSSLLSEDLLSITMVSVPLMKV